MDLPILLWIDLRVNNPHQPLNPSDRLHGICSVVVESRLLSIHESILKFNPRVLCFDFDYLDLGRLRALQQTKLAFQALPILMLTEQHSEALAVWAFRTGVRDYVVKPVSTTELAWRVKTLLDLSSASARAARHNALILNPIPTDARLHSHEPGQHRTLQAVSYIEAHLHGKINLCAIAELCDMTPFEFSRAFKREHGLTFRDYLIRCRLEKACALLRHPSASIMDIACVVGFNDLSHFDRVFRQHLGVTPSSYRSRHLQESSNGPVERS